MAADVLDVAGIPSSTVVGCTIEHVALGRDEAEALVPELDVNQIAGGESRHATPVLAVVLGVEEQAVLADCPDVAADA